jgi:acyl-CoA thioesterase
MTNKLTPGSGKAFLATGPHQFIMPGWISCAPFEELLKIEIIEAKNGKATLTMPFLKEFSQGAGLMHGGALVSLADTTVVMAIKSILPPKTHFGTISLTTSFLYPVKQGIVTARASVMQEKERTFLGKATVYNEDEKQVLDFTSTFKVAKDAIIKNIDFRNDSK